MSERLLSGTRGLKWVVFAVRELMLPCKSWMCSVSRRSCHSSSLLLQACPAMAFACCLHGAFPPEPSATCDGFCDLSCSTEYSFAEIITCCIEYIALRKLLSENRFSHAMLQLGHWRLGKCAQGSMGGKGKLPFPLVILHCFLKQMFVCGVSCFTDSTSPCSGRAEIVSA